MVVGSVACVRVCLSVCLFVCPALASICERFDLHTSFGKVCLRNIYVKVEYQGHGVKVKDINYDDTKVIIAVMLYLRLKGNRHGMELCSFG